MSHRLASIRALPCSIAVPGFQKLVGHSPVDGNAADLSGDAACEQHGDQYGQQPSGFALHGQQYRLSLCLSLGGVPAWAITSRDAELQTLLKQPEGTIPGAV